MKHQGSIVGKVGEGRRNDDDGGNKGVWDLTGHFLIVRAVRPSAFLQSSSILKGFPLE